MSSVRLAKQMAREPVESVHFGVNSKVQNARFGLYRDFPDAVRREGEEKF